MIFLSMRTNEDMRVVGDDTLLDGVLQLVDDVLKRLNIFLLPSVNVCHNTSCETTEEHQEENHHAQQKEYPEIILHLHCIMITIRWAG